MRNSIRLLTAFLTRDFHIEASYRLSFVLSFSSILFSTFIFYFIAQIVDISQAAPQGAAELAANDQDYFAFALVGIAFAAYFGVGLRSFASGLRSEQTTGTLEAVMLTPTPVSTVIVGSALWSYVFTTIRVGVYLLLGALLGIRFNVSSILVPVAVCLLAIITFASIGIIAAAVIMIIKRGDPVTAIMSNFANLVGGVFYPIEVLPDWLQAIARLLPITYALRAMRASLLTGATFSDVAFDLAALAIFCIILFPLSLLLFRYAVQWAKREGTLSHY
ncbi:MAG: ABC transporter permease [Anaerolineae bacterium]|nr:ABC transporter permease [Anaerolineae bacterium]MCO5187636.1 ABC transporter permease [Anaerolineae bacterium]MCO5194298.1 ABC transporter permease [Anaerolineae bacterium]MCO5197350.1 ABC transporter permease [Anaerolineae bacterium]MCO5205018.1 ABC transporter permease [Anaerolineae bacterium]